MRGIGGRRDKNHGPIREGLRACGFTVEDNADAGNGKPDLIVGAYQTTFLLEVKAEKGKESDEQRQCWQQIVEDAGFLFEPRCRCGIHRPDPGGTWRRFPAPTMRPRS